MEKELVLGDLEQELRGTRRMLEACQDGHFGWTPHDRSWSLGELATHLATLNVWMIGILREDRFDLAELPPPRAALVDREALLKAFDTGAEDLRGLVAALDAGDLEAEWSLVDGKTVRARMPRALALRAYGISHMIHHRAQVGVYLRLLGERVPGVYGPTADDVADPEGATPAGDGSGGALSTSDVPHGEDA